MLVPKQEYIDEIDDIDDYLNFIFDEECSIQDDEEDLDFLLDYLSESGDNDGV